MKKTNLFYFTAFISGLSVMAVEMTASRLLSPFFGTSLFVWTNVIGLIMMALAAGYYFGGRMADKHPKPRPYFCLVFLTGIWILLIPFISGFVINAVMGLFPNLAGMMITGSFISVLLLVVTPMVLLGMIVPYTVKLVTHKIKEVGRASGRVSALSTLGSIIGTFLPAFVLIPVLGTTTTFILLGIILLIVASIGLRIWWVYLLTVLAIPLFWFVPAQVFASDDIIYMEESPYQLIFVKEYESGRREFYIDNQFGIQSVYEPDLPLLEEYYSYFGVLPAMVDDPQNVLILGHAGGSYTQIFNEYYPDLQITGVELDPRVTAVAKEYFFLDEAEVTIIHGDARSYLLTTDETFDVIILDAYHVMSIPAHLATEEFFHLVNEHLEPDGVFGVNALSHGGDFLDTLVNTIASEFAEVMLVPIPTSLNSMVVAQESGGFDLNGLPEVFLEIKDYIDYEVTYWEFDEKTDVFTDNKSALVEIKTQGMMLDLFSS